MIEIFNSFGPEGRGLIVFGCFMIVIMVISGFFQLMLSCVKNQIECENPKNITGLCLKRGGTQAECDREIKQSEEGT